MTVPTSHLLMDRILVIQAQPVTSGFLGPQAMIRSEAITPEDLANLRDDLGRIGVVNVVEPVPSVVPACDVDTAVAGRGGESDPRVVASIVLTSGHEPLAAILKAASTTGESAIGSDSA